MKRLLRLFALACLLSAIALGAQDLPGSDPCGAMPKAAGAAKNFLAFGQFDKELRVAIARQDAVALAFLVKFPLRVNDRGGTISIDNAGALKTHFQGVFTPAVRKEILRAASGDVGCNIEGIGYGLGVIWVNPSEQGYAIWSVNRDVVPSYLRSSRNSRKINYICQTQTNRIVVDTVADGELRYRAWKKPRPVMGVPDLEIAKGVGTFEGTNFCAVPIYTFKSGSAVYRLGGGLGCFGDSEPGPPKGATGSLEVTLADKPALDSWCY